MPPSPSPLLLTLADIAREASAIIMAFRRKGVDAEQKRDGSPVTEADRRAEAMITAALERQTPSLPVVGEEASEKGHAPATPGDSFWLVDPLDGTRDYIAGRDHFTVNIGLVRNGQAIAGVVCAPTSDSCYVGADTQAFLSRKGGAFTHLAPPRLRPPAQGLTVAVSSHRAGAREDTFLKTLAIEKRIAMGSSIKFCLLAEGAADVYPRFSRTMEWDTAAGHAVLNAAGGEVTTPEGNPLLYGKSGFINPAFVARRFRA